jgi:hypothetical protein
VTTTREAHVRMSPHATTPETLADELRESLTALRLAR